MSCPSRKPRLSDCTWTYGLGPATQAHAGIAGSALLFDTQDDSIPDVVGCIGRSGLESSEPATSLTARVRAPTNPPETAPCEVVAPDGQFREAATSVKAAVLDQAMNALLADLLAKGLLNQTLLVLGTEFGRTLRINDNDGRDRDDEAVA